MVSVPPGGVAPAATGRERRPETAVSLEDKYAATSGSVLISGIEALVRVTLDQRRLDRSRGLATGVFVSGYEGSPLGGVDLEFARSTRFTSELGVVFSPGVNEELAATAVAGTQLVGQLPGRRVDGVTGFWYGKNPGLDRAVDAIRHGNLAGTAPLGGAVAWIGDDPQCKSSTIPSSCEPTVASIGIPLLAPASISDILTLGLHAVALSRFSGLWVGFKMVTELADGAATVELADPASFIAAPEVREATPRVLLGARALAAEADLLDERLPRALRYAREAGLNTIAFEPHGPRLGVVAAGHAYAVTLRALADLGLGPEQCEAAGIRLIKLAMPWPLDPPELRRLVAGLDEVLVVEDKTSFVEARLRDALYHQHHQPTVVGKTDGGGAPLLSAHGALESDAVARAIGACLPDDVLAPATRSRLELLRRPERVTLSVNAFPARTPYFCSGCPHNISTRAGDDQLVGMGIGCHTMVAFDASGRGHIVGMTQMGGEGAQWTGMAPFTDDPHYFQNLGDGTFFHSGSLAIRAAVAGGANITYKLLYNQAVAMTGGQRPEGQMTIPDLTRWLALEGVTAVVVTTPDPATYDRVDLDPIAEVRHRDDLVAVQRELSERPGVTVLIHDDRCAAEERRLRKRNKIPLLEKRVWINQRVCEGCGDCGVQSSCLSVVPVETELGRKTAIHQGSCNQDYSCLKGNCPAFVVVVPSHRNEQRPVPDIPLAPPEPHWRAPDGDVLIRMPGIGGTGVVTVSRVLQMAAHLDGHYTTSVEQTGLAQKGGPVISDVRLSNHPIDAAARAGAHSVDLLLGFDLLGAADPATLRVAEAGRTIAVINTAAVATAQMVMDTGVQFPTKPLVATRIDEGTNPRQNVYVDADWIAERLFGEHLASNMVLVGAAYQHGCLPITGASIERSIELNGTAVEENLRAFRWGRAVACDARLVHATLGAPTGPEHALPAPAPGTVDLSAIPESLYDMVGRRAADLIAYQNPAYARRYLDDVAALSALEGARRADGDFSLTETYARFLYKLMAHKDEYEVARLHLDAAERARLEAEFGPSPRRRVQLLPPALKAMGLRRKISLGWATTPAFVALRVGRHLRATPLDPFGHTKMKRLERKLLAHYREVAHRVVADLDVAHLDTVAEVLALPDMIRGYEEVRAANIERYRARERELVDQLSRVSV